jgi:hypothetical protein
MRTGKTIVIVATIVIVICCVVGAVLYQIKEFYDKRDPVLEEIKSSLKPLFDKEDFSGLLTKLNNGNLVEKTPIYKSKGGSYTINKKHVHICMHDELGEYYDRNMLIYVLIHELAHVICDEVGHTELFNMINDELLVEAAAMGLYNPSIPILVDYCKHHESHD